MRAKAVKRCENPFLYAEEGCSFCYVGVLILSTLALISKWIFFIGTLCVFVVNDRWNRELFCSINRHGPVDVINVKYYVRTHYYYSSGGVKENSERI